MTSDGTAGAATVRQPAHDLSYAHAVRGDAVAGAAELGQSELLHTDWTCRGRALEDALNLRDLWMLDAMCQPDFRMIGHAGEILKHDDVMAAVASKFASVEAFRILLCVWATEGKRCVFRMVAEARDPEHRQWNRTSGLVALQLGPAKRLAFAHCSMMTRPIAGGERLLLWPDGRRPGDHPKMLVLGI